MLASAANVLKLLSLIPLLMMSVKPTINRFSLCLCHVFWTLRCYVFTGPPIMNTYCLSIPPPTCEFVVYLDSQKSSVNLIMLSPPSGPADPEPGVWLSSCTSIQRAIFFDHISFIAPLTVPSVFYISPRLLVFILWLQSGPGPGSARPANTDVNSYKSYITAEFNS